MEGGKGCGGGGESCIKVFDDSGKGGGEGVGKPNK